VTRALKTVDGVRSVQVDYRAKTATVQGGSAACSADAVGDMRSALKQVGYGVTVRRAR